MNSAERRRRSDRRHRTQQLRRIYRRDNGICQLCGEPCSVPDASREHVVRLADGGSSDDSNVVLAHKKCNLLADTNPADFPRNYTSQSPGYEVQELPELVQPPMHFQDQLTEAVAVGPDVTSTVTDSDTQK